VVRSLFPDEAKAFLDDHAEGAYTLLDVRQPGEYEELHIPGARLIPLPELMDALVQLDPAKPTLVYCAVGGRSRVAALMLEGKGFGDVFHLEGGMYAWEGREAVGPRELHLDMVRGDESPLEMLQLAYDMEVGLGRFYELAAARIEEHAVRQLLSKLIAVEEIHQRRLVAMAERLRLSPHEGLRTSQGGQVETMEGGFHIETFLEENVSFLETLQGVLELALMLESQALDLYARFAEKSRGEETRGVLHDIAQEEKGHLVLLGRLMEEARLPAGVR
jgi:rhodanese-related sulfurtransferase/rubrerythrin